VIEPADAHRLADQRLATLAQAAGGAPADDPAR
jgi:hypothetical protein